MKKKIFAMLIAVATVGGAIPAGATTITNRAQLAAITFDLAGDVLHVAPRRRPVGRLTSVLLPKALHILRSSRTCA